MKVVIADDLDLVRQGIEMVLSEASFDCIILGSFSSGADVLSWAKQNHADIYLLDISMPGKTGLDVTRELMEIQPDAKVIIFSMHDNPEFVAQAIQVGAKGFLSKQEVQADIHSAIRVVHKGGLFFSNAEGLEAFFLGKGK